MIITNSTTLVGPTIRLLSNNHLNATGTNVTVLEVKARVSLVLSTNEVLVVNEFIQLYRLSDTNGTKLMLGSVEMVYVGYEGIVLTAIVSVPLNESYTIFIHDRDGIRASIPLCPDR